MLRLSVVRVCFFSLSFPTKQDCCDVAMRAVTIWGQGRGKERVSECATCEQKRKGMKGKKRHRP